MLGAVTHDLLPAVVARPGVIYNAGFFALLVEPSAVRQKETGIAPVSSYAGKAKRLRNRVRAKMIGQCAANTGKLNIAAKSIDTWKPTTHA